MVSRALSQIIAITRQEARLDSIVWILGPVVVAFFGFLFWVVMGKLGSDQSKDDDAAKNNENPPENLDD